MTKTLPITHANRLEKMMGLSVAIVLLKIDVTPLEREELCRLCETVNDVLDVALAMQNAKEGHRLLAAFRFIKNRHPSTPPAAPPTAPVQP
jgi:hypothetical protein